ncbi:hypothetical protein BKA61DRAFT_598399 [Leptodontidium sp. MPI-SDFR-AT-0119]|nr:hypothetical protein BKA61DRAFT_598399 [Leptodontidium sp. MPI-SDFR-AT-0119]
MHLHPRPNPALRITCCCLLLVEVSLQQVSIGNRIDDPDPNEPPAAGRVDPGGDIIPNITSRITGFSSLNTSLSSSTIATPTFTLPTQSPSGPPLVKDGGMSTGAKAGIGIGAGLGAIAILGILVFAIRYKRKSAARKGRVGRERFEKAELDGSGKYLVAKAGEIEIGGEVTKPVELDGKERRAEMEGKVKDMRSELA